MLAFAAFLLWNLLRALERLGYACSRTLWSSYVAVWLAVLLSVTKLLVQVLSARPTAWDAVSLVHSFGTLSLQVAVISLLLHGFLGGLAGFKARSFMYPTKLAACTHLKVSIHPTCSLRPWAPLFILQCCHDCNAAGPACDGAAGAGCGACGCRCPRCAALCSPHPALLHPVSTCLGRACM